jgi:hypothetical protein
MKNFPEAKSGENAKRQLSANVEDIRREHRSGCCQPKPPRVFETKSYGSPELIRTTAHNFNPPELEDISRDEAPTVLL